MAKSKIGDMKAGLRAHTDPFVLFLTFETEFSAFGGLGAVMKLLPREVGADGCAVMAPYFRNLMDLGKAQRAGQIKSVRELFAMQVLIRGEAYGIDVTEVENRDGLKTFLIGADRFFRAVGNPYVNPCDPSRPLHPFRNPINTDQLTEDALFFSIAAPQVLTELVKERRIRRRDLVLHMQDWETAPAALAVRLTRTAPAIRSIRSVLTIHNPYDKPLHRRNSARVCDFADHLGLVLGRSVLEQSMPALDAPVSTVSRHFAHELRNEPLYTQIFCPHLQRVFKNVGLVGIDNGIFGTPDLPFSVDAVRQAAAGRFTKLLGEKREKRAALAGILARYVEAARARDASSCWGGPLNLNDPDVPVFFVLGRDDPRQKGFDAVVEAVRRLPRGTARFIFAVIPGDEGFEGLDFMKQLAKERPEDVCVFAHRVEKDVFTALREGCSYMVMGSMYEPFGAASEAYLCGMPVVARATGGLVQQVMPHPACMEHEKVLSLEGRRIVKHYHTAKSRPTGILYREQVSFAEEVEGWRVIVDCRYWDENPKGRRTADRERILLYRSMQESAAAALKLAAELYRKPDEYAAMIVNGLNMLKKFSWKKSVKGYRDHLYREQQAAGVKQQKARSRAKGSGR